MVRVMRANDEHRKIQTVHRHRLSSAQTMSVAGQLQGSDSHLAASDGQALRAFRVAEG